jgi:hypothetical protein
VETKISYIRWNQKKIRAELYQGLQDALFRGEGPARVGLRIVLPSSIVGSPRHMQQLYQDSMALVRKFGKPDLFITMTCNPNWDEILEALLPGQQAADRPDIVARVWNEKLKEVKQFI